MTEAWYESVSADEPLTQGDLIRELLLIRWEPSAEHAAEVAEETLLREARVIRADVVVMTQACDLEHGKVRHVVFCPHHSLSHFRTAWEELARSSGQNPTAKAWRKMCQDIAEGHVWNQTFLNAVRFGDGDAEEESRVVEFRQVYTATREYVESLLLARGECRLRLRPPYREHLSQAFARFFMRVGLPQAVRPDWEK